MLLLPSLFARLANYLERLSSLFVILFAAIQVHSSGFLLPSIPFYPDDLVPDPIGRAAYDGCLLVLDAKGLHALDK